MRTQRRKPKFSAGSQQHQILGPRDRLRTKTPPRAKKFRIASRSIRFRAKDDFTAFDIGGLGAFASAASNVLLYDLPSTRRIFARAGERRRWIDATRFCAEHRIAAGESLIRLASPTRSARAATRIARAAAPSASRAPPSRSTMRGPAGNAPTARHSRPESHYRRFASCSVHGSGSAVGEANFKIRGDIVTQSRLRPQARRRDRRSGAIRICMKHSGYAAGDH